MGMTQREPVDIRQGEMLAILSSLIGQPAERIGGWVLLVRLSCGADDCVGLGCEGGPLAFLSAGEAEGLPSNEPYLLHMLGTGINEIARGMRDRPAS